eukprot:6178488-Pleurochrysis_carterae.AAC.1
MAAKRTDVVQARACYRWTKKERRHNMNTQDGKVLTPEEKHAIKQKNSKVTSLGESLQRTHHPNVQRQRTFGSAACDEHLRSFTSPRELISVRLMPNWHQHVHLRVVAQNVA